ncbi:hypothetical protein CMV_012061 [Castanea mollissima]|uniref:Uncharacterized protein n=1 Tax=Castanea mollissima TaxID=60419 RepID=A0A8J4RJC3_9ROSI|nr:hypothetical protein CMV_012061 [Castanea mollissima]
MRMMPHSCFECALLQQYVGNSFAIIIGPGGTCRDVVSFSGQRSTALVICLTMGPTTSSSAFLCATAKWGPHSETGGHCQVGLLSSTRSGRPMCQLLPE